MLVSDTHACVDMVTLIKPAVVRVLVAGDGFGKLGSALGADLIRPERVGGEQCRLVALHRDELTIGDRQQPVVKGTVHERVPKRRHARTVEALEEVLRVLVHLLEGAGSGLLAVDLAEGQAVDRHGRRTLAGPTVAHGLPVGDHAREAPLHIAVLYAPHYLARFVVALHVLLLEVVVKRSRGRERWSAD